MTTRMCVKSTQSQHGQNWLPSKDQRGNSILEQSISYGEHKGWIIQSMN